MIHYVGSQIFEEYFKEEFIYQVGKFAESEGYNLLRLLPDNDNTLLTSYKTSLFQMTEIVDSIDN